jgi:hypothetical protein
MKPQVFLSILTLAALMLACNLPIAPIHTIPIAAVGEATKYPTKNTPIPPTNTSPAAPPTVSPVPLPSESPTIALTPTPSTPMLTPADKPVNCRFGPGVEYAVVGWLLTGESVQIQGKNAAGDWWYIQPPKNPGAYCWVAAKVTVASGNLAVVNVLAPSETFVTKVTLKLDLLEITVPGCVFPYIPIDMTGSIISNGPAVVKWHWETSQGDVSSTETLKFNSFDTKTVTGYVKYGGEGKYWVKLVITKPNSLVAQAKYKVVCGP